MTNYKNVDSLLTMSEFIEAVKNMPERDEVIEGILPKNEVMLMAGDPWQGKSLEVQRLAVSFGCNDGNYHGLKLHKCRSLYLTWEGAHKGIAQRFTKISADMRCELEPIVMRLDDRLPIDNAPGREKMHRLIGDAKSKYPDIEVIVFDSFPYTFGGQTKDDVDINNWWAELQMIVHTFDITPILIWQFTKLVIQRGFSPEPFGIDRLQGCRAVAYKANTVVAIGEHKIQKRQPDSTVKWITAGSILAVIKSKDSGRMDNLSLGLEGDSLAYTGQHWIKNDVTGEYLASTDLGVMLQGGGAVK
jgi:archaellum biogenesis ATPase FlaH